MNKNAKQFFVKKCRVCGFVLSDSHHVYPRSMLYGSFYEKFRVFLCPNHRRCAHVVYTWIDAGHSDVQIEKTVRKLFDKDFSDKMLPYLLRTYRATKDSATRGKVLIFESLVYPDDPPPKPAVPPPQRQYRELPELIYEDAFDEA